jgi:hypothetical protein
MRSGSAPTGLTGGADSLGGTVPGGDAYLRVMQGLTTKVVPQEQGL